MFSQRQVYLNGDFVNWDQSQVHLLSHSFGRGSAIFEVISFYQTDQGPAVFRLNDHLDRLLRSAELLLMDLAQSKEEVKEAALETVRINGLDQGYIKIIAYYGQVAFEAITSQKTPDLAIFALDPDQDLGGLEAPQPGISACVSKWRKLHPETVPIEAKAAANYINGIMARQEAINRGFDNGIMLDSQGFIAECSTESVFLVKDGRLMTPALGTVLAGISRKSLLEAAGAIGLETVQARLKPELLLEAEEIFLASTAFKVMPVYKIEDRLLDQVPGPVSRKLSALLEDISSGRDQRFRDWLTPVRPA
ncbi:MAG: branched-chain-amino-acid transaminase [Deltaproteobacteria bacterium]|nr:branched-chain-amino-acid transaminase [Deltaproteobacteria bacterium]